MSGIGHNSGVTVEDIEAAAKDPQLVQLFERIERLREEKKEIADDEKDVFSEAKALGYDSKIMREVLKLRKMAPNERQEMELLVDTYKAAIGML